MITDPIADLLTRIRNAQRARHRSVTVRGSKMVKAVLEVLKREGFIESFKDSAATDTYGAVDVSLRYLVSGDPIIAQARRVSTPGRRVYSSLSDLPRIQRGLGIAVLSTSKGVISDKEARVERVGGEVLAFVG